MRAVCGRLAELSAKLTEGETGRTTYFQVTPAYLSLRLGCRRATSLVRGRHRDTTRPLLFLY